MPGPYYNRGPAVNMRRQHPAPAQPVSPAPETVPVSAEKTKEATPLVPRKSLIDSVIEKLSPFFSKIAGRELKLEDIIIIGLIILLIMEKAKNKKDATDKEKTNFSLKNLTDNDFLLLALFYIFI